MTVAEQLKWGAGRAYHAAMRPDFRSSLCTVVLGMGAALAAFGCDTGGLLVVEHKGPVQGPSTSEMVNGGTFASNAKYRLFYTNGQPTPNQGVSTSDTKRLNGGLAGAVHSD